MFSDDREVGENEAPITTAHEHGEIPSSIFLFAINPIVRVESAATKNTALRTVLARMESDVHFASFIDNSHTVSTACVPLFFRPSDAKKTLFSCTDKLTVDMRVATWDFELSVRSCSSKCSVFSMGAAEFLAEYCTFMAKRNDAL
jgi:hypothetical protein